MRDRDITHPPDHEHLAELIRLHKPFAELGDGGAEEFTPGVFLVQLAGVSIWVRATEPAFPSIRLSSCVFDFTKYPDPGQTDGFAKTMNDREPEIAKLANDLHDQTGSTQTQLRHKGRNLWLTGSVNASVFDPEETGARLRAFADVAVRCIEPVQWRFNGPGLLGLPKSR